MTKKKQNGFSLLEVLIAMAIATAGTMGIYQIIQNSQKRLNTVESRDEVSQVHREIIGFLTNRYTCTSTLKEALNKGELPQKIEMIVSQNGSEILTIPTQINKINVNSMEVVKVKEEMAEINMGYTYKIAGKETQVERNFRIEIERKENEVASCISRGTLGLDPKEACDLVVGYNEEGSSYYENGRCRFAKASCEQSGRVWDETLSKCNFSEEDLKALREEICYSLGYGKYNPATERCTPSQELLEAVEKFMKQTP